MDKILVTGVAGFIGSNLANYLVQNENNFVYGIDDFSHSTMSNLYPLLKNERFEFVEHNLKNEIPYQVDYVYHFAGNGDYSSYYDDKYTFILDKIEITKNIITSCQKCGSKLIYPTCYQDRQEKNKNLFEYYDCINLIENLIVELINSNKLNCNIVRLDSVYGENLLKNDNRFISTTLKKIFTNESFILNTDESNYFTYVKDVVINLEKIMTSYISNPIIDLINQNLYLKSDIIKLMIKYCNSDSKIELKSEIQEHPTFKPTQDARFNCNTSVVDGIINTIKNFKLIYYS